MRSSKKWALFRFAFLALFAITLVLSPGSANAQLSAGSVTGIVRDASGSVVASASVTLRNIDTAIQHTTVSNDAGNYVFLNIGPGRYALEASAAGFATQKVAEFVLAVNQTASIDIALKVGSQSEVVTISAETEQLDVSTADLGTVIATKQVNDLPLNGRNFTQLLSLTPGVAPVSVAQNSMGGRAGGFGAPISVGSAFIFPAVNGQTNRSNFFLTDGLNNFGAFQSTYSVPPIVDAIQEFKVVSHTDSAQFGSVLGGVVNVVTKSGTNEYHGTTWEYVRNTAFDARNTFLQKVTPFRQNQFGASVGGPVWIPKLYNGRNKTFFYFAYQGFRYTQDSDSLLKVPTAAQLAGDESSFPTQIYNPFSTRPDPANPGKYIRDPFPGNQIPSNLIDPRMVAFARAVLPQAGPVLDGNGDNAIDSTPNHQTQNEYNVRVDQNFGQKNTVFFRYSAVNSLLTAAGGVPGLIKQGSIPGRNWGGSYVHIFNPSLVLQVQYARTTNQDNSATLFTNAPANLDSTVGFASSFVGGFAAAGGHSLIPSPGINGYASGGENITDVPKATDSHQVSGNLTKIVGNHTLTFGGGFTSNRFESPLSYASLSFAGGQTGNPQNPNEPGDPLASFLLNVPDGANRRNVHETTRPGGLMSLFIQDSWKATSKLAVNFGLRYDRTFIPAYGTNATIGQQGGIETGDFDFSTGTYILQKLPPPCSVRGFAPCIPGNGTLPAHVVVDPRGKIAHDTLTNFGPRIGFAYRLGNRTVLRGAAGIVYDNWAAVSQMAQNIEGAWPDIGQLIANNLNQPSTTSATPTITAQDPFAGGGSGLFPAPTPFNQVLWFYDPHIKNPYSMQWNFGVQRELNSSTTVDVNYVGSGSRRLNVGGYYNTALTPGPGDPQTRAPFPYIAPTFYDRSIGNGSYNALQIDVNKRYSNGLAYQVAYTYSKSIDEGSSGWFGVEGQSLTDPYNVAGSRGPSGFDLRHTLSVNMLYQIPVGHGMRFSTKNNVLDYVLGNWQLNNIFTARSGVPFNVYYGASDLANTGNVSWAQYERANLVGDPHSGSCPNGSPVGSVDCIFNTSAFAVPAQFTFGNSGRDAFRSPSYWNLDTSIFRQFPFWGEGRRLEFRAEAFNVFNTVILGTPGNDISNLSSFGKANSTANSPRQLQLGAKIIF
jgi:Carboxypeptidase regulatory-like domain